MTKPAKPVPAQQTPIVFGTILIDGIPVKQDTRVVIAQAFAGRPILISADKDYVNLYHVYDRRNRRLPLKERRQLVRQQIGPSRWNIFIVRHRDEVPALKLEPDYDPKRGRYLRYARQLAAGDQLILRDQKEAIKARRAWQLYIPKAERRHLRSSVRRLPGKVRTFLVETKARAVR